MTRSGQTLCSANAACASGTGRLRAGTELLNHPTTSPPREPSPHDPGSCLMMDPEPDECELARRARDGDQEALSELIERVRLRLFALAYAELRHYDDAQDAVASALLRICRHVGELREPERARAWMNTIVRNEARRRLSSRAG